MSMQSEGKDAKGRNYDQATRDGSSSAGSMGSGGTGDIGAMGGAGGGSQQSASRTDDLLAGATTDQEADQAFSGGSQSGQVQTGMEGIGKGSAGKGRGGCRHRQDEERHQCATKLHLHPSAQRTRIA